MAYLNQFSVRVLGGRELPGGYVELSHGQQYTLQLRNGRSVPCDASVWIDGKEVGTWRIERGSSIALERPVHDTGRFTFYRAGTAEAASAQLSESSPDLGLVRIVFRPERLARPLPNVQVASAAPVVSDPAPSLIYGTTTTYTNAGSWTETSTALGAMAENPTVSAYYSHAASAQARGIAPGGTGLSGRSSQTFWTVPELDHDATQETTIFLRLVSAGSDEPRPLTQYSTPVPPPVR